MLSTHPDEKKLRAAWNLFPRADGALGTRPGALQVATGATGKAVGWGNRVLFEKAGRIVLWDGAAEHDIAPTGYTLQAVPYQAVTGGGAREDRLYVADGINPLWYIHKSGGSYVQTTVVNECLDGSSTPYAIPVAFCIANWRNRLWIGDGTHRIYHAQNDRPHYWDPLWELQCQSGGPHAVRAVRPMGETLAVGLEQGWWGVTGTSQLNWQRGELVRGRGVSGPDAAAAFGNRLWYADSTGLFELSGETPISEDLREAFEELPAGVQLAVWPTRRLLFMNVTGRVFVMHIDAPGRFAELHGFPLFGIFAGDQIAGWYGTDGLWVYGQDALPDQYADGSQRAITTRYDTWDQQPNNQGSGRALCRRTILVVSGPPTSMATYTLTSDEAASSENFDLSPTETTLPDVPGIAADYWPFRRARRELVPNVPGQFFRHVVETTAALRIHSFDPLYRFGRPED